MSHNHHDTGYKALFSHPEFVQQLIEGFAPPEIAQLMDFSTLENHSGNYPDKGGTPLFQEKIEDRVWSVQVSWNGLRLRIFLYLLLEFQSTVIYPIVPIVALIQADLNKQRMDEILTRWIKRHLHYLDAHINLGQLNCLRGLRGAG
jgi:hypothetical protein